MSDDIRDEYEPLPGTAKARGRKGLAAMRARSRDWYDDPRNREQMALVRRNIPITLPKFKCLEEPEDRHSKDGAAG